MCLWCVSAQVPLQLRNVPLAAPEEYLPTLTGSATSLQGNVRNDVRKDVFAYWLIFLLLELEVDETGLHCRREGLAML